jgi:hypothetical protein
MFHKNNYECPRCSPVSPVPVSLLVTLDDGRVQSIQIQLGNGGNGCQVRLLASAKRFLTPISPQFLQFLPEWSIVIAGRD